MPRKPKVRFDPAVAEKVQEYAAVGMTQDQVAVVLGCSVDTIQRHYHEAWLKGKASANAKIAKRLFEKAMSGDTASLIFWTKAQMGWKESQNVDHTSSDGSMSPKEISIDISKLSPEELATKARAAFKGEARPYE